MGKRELVLVLTFVVIGVVVYQLTATPPPAGQQGFSFSRLFQNVRRATRGRPAHATVQKTRSEAIDPSTNELRVKVPIVDLTVVGEDRTDVATELSVDSDGVDQADAQKLANATNLQWTQVGNGLAVGIDFPVDGRQRASLTVHVPRRFVVRVESKTGKLDIQHVSSVDVRGNRGDSRISDIAGEVGITHRSGSLNVTQAGSVRLTVSGGDAHVSEVRGAGSIDISGSNLELAGIRGPLDVKSRGTDVRLRDIGQLQPTLRLDMQSGELVIDGLQTETRIEGRNTEMRVALARAAPLTIYNTAEDVVITAPPDGYTLDAVATDGVLSIDDGPGGGVAVAKAADEREQRASGAVRGGGPTISLRNTNGDISIRKHEGK